MQAQHRYFWFDLIRGISAVMVCATHLRAALFVNFSNLETPTFFAKVFYFSTGFGHQAVKI